MSLFEVYYESWRAGSGTYNSDPSKVVSGFQFDTGLHLDGISCVIFSFADFAFTNGEGKVSGLNCSEEVFKAGVKAIQASNRKVKLAFGGATYSLAKYLKSDADAQRLADEIAGVAKNYGLDGVDLDIEDYPLAEHQISLFKELRAQLPKPFLISYTVKAPYNTEPYKDVIEGACQYLDSVNVMAYDTYKGYSVIEDMKGYLTFMKASQLTLGIMSGKDDMGVMTTVDMAKEYAAYARENELYGVMLWDLNRDSDGSYTQAIGDVLKLSIIRRIIKYLKGLFGLTS